MRRRADQFQGFDLPYAENNLRHFSAGVGGIRFYDPAKFQAISTVATAERGVQQHFTDWIAGRLKPKDLQEEVVESLRNLQPGQSMTRPAQWQAALNPSVTNDAFWAFGDSFITGNGSFTFTRDKDKIRIEGTVVQSWSDPYDFKDGRLTHEAALLQDWSQGRAKPYKMESEWRQKVTGTLVKRGGLWVLDGGLRWEDAHPFYGGFAPRFSYPQVGGRLSR